jgi:hypothetical protein
MPGGTAMKKTLCLFIVTSGLVLPSIGQSQLAVLDAFNASFNLVTSLQSVALVANAVLELTGLGTIEVSDTYADELALLGTVATEARGLVNDIGQLTTQIKALVDISTAPDAPGLLQERLRELRQAQAQMQLYAIRVQVLTSSTASAIGHLTRLVAAVGDLTGNKAGQQTLIQLQARLNHTAHVQQIQAAATQQAQAVDKLAEYMEAESADRINQRFWQGSPSAFGGN